MKIIKKPVKQKSIYIIKMCGDYNDGDYSYSEETFTESEFSIIANCLLEVQKLVGRDYVNDDYGYENVDEHIMKLQEEYDVEFNFPSGDTSSDLPIHSLESLEIQFVDVDGNIYDVILKD